MVRVWNREPSPELSRSASSPKKHSPAAHFSSSSERFGYDGKPRVPNFLNGRDAQHTEARATLLPVDTCTHTRYDWSAAGAGLASNSLAAAVAQSLNNISTMRSTRTKSATARSLAVADTRYDRLPEPYGDHVGPGAYDTARGLPGVGTAPADSHTCSASPQRDPYRASPPFLAPQRPGSAAGWLLRPGGPDCVYVSPQWEPGPSRCVPWELSCDRRPDVTEWGGAAATGGSSPGRGDPHRDPSPGPGAVDVTRDVAGRALDLAARAAERNANGVAFSSKEPRLVPLPADRHNDLRPARHAALGSARGHGPDTATSHLGPGAYAPPVSPGGPRGGRRTYRLFVDPATHPQPSNRFGGGVQEDAASVVRAHGRGHRGPGQPGLVGMGSPRSPRGSGGDGSLTARSVGSSSVGGGGGGGGGGVARMGASSSFAGPFRSQCSGAYHGRMDSSLVRRH